MNAGHEQWIVKRAYDATTKNQRERKTIRRNQMAQRPTVTQMSRKFKVTQLQLQFRFFLYLVTTNLSRRNKRARAGLQTLFNSRENGNRQWILITFHVYSRYLAATRDVRPTATWCKWLTFRFTTMMQRNQSAHTAWVNSVQRRNKPDILIGQ